MGIMVKKDDQERDELTRRINADLREKIAVTQQVSDEKDPDFVDDSDYTTDLKTTSKFGWVWILLVAIALGLLIILGVSFGH